jgi:HD-like signal output (HDOD) protein
MAALIARLCSIFSQGSKPELSANNQLPDQVSASIQPLHNEAVEPGAFALKAAQQGFYDTIFSPGNPQQQLSSKQKQTAAEVASSLKEQQKRIKAVPRLPSVIPKLLKSLRDPNASAKDYVNIINKDPALSTAVLKMANSVYFNPQSNTISSIENAVVKLGLTGLRTVLSTAVMQPVMQGRSKHLAAFSHQLWTHSLCCAAACEIIARQRQLEPFKAYLLGLVHDIGTTTIVNQLSIQHSQHTPQQKLDYSIYAPLIQDNAQLLSATIAKDWELPEELSSALKQQIKLTPGSALSPYAHVLFQANLACEIYAIAKQDQDQLPAAQQALEELGLPEDLFERLDLIATEL